MVVMWRYALYMLVVSNVMWLSILASTGLNVFTNLLIGASAFLAGSF